MHRALLLLALGLSACGPMTVKRAEEVCLERARGATGPHGSISVGSGTAGPAASVELNVSSDYLMGRDPSELYNTCVFQKSGQMPSRPLYDLPGWKR